MPWGSTIASAFEFYNIRSLKFVYVPTCNTDIEGQIIMSYLYDVAPSSN